MAKGFMKKVFNLGESMENMDGHQYGDKLETVGVEIREGAELLGLTGIALETESLGIATEVVGAIELTAGLAKEVGDGLSFIGAGVNFVSDSVNNTGKFLESISSVKKKTPKQYENHACIASMAYKDDKDCDGLDFDENLSIDKLDVYTDGQEQPKNLYLGIEGTNFHKKTILNDLYDDSKILDDTLEDGATFKRMNEHITKLKKLHPNAKIHLGSHSLGGALAHKLACNHNFESNVTFNSGSVPWAKQCNKKSEVVNITTGRDLISLSTLIPRKNEKTIIVRGKKKVNDPLFHSMEFF